MLPHEPDLFLSLSLSPPSPGSQAAALRTCVPCICSSLGSTLAFQVCGSAGVASDLLLSSNPSGIGAHTAQTWSSTTMLTPSVNFIRLLCSPASLSTSCMLSSAGSARSLRFSATLSSRALRLVCPASPLQELAEVLEAAEPRASPCPVHPAKRFSGSVLSSTLSELVLTRGGYCTSQRVRTQLTSGS